MSILPTTPASGPSDERTRTNVKNLLRLWFSVDAPVTPRAYRDSGFFLIVVKYAVDAGLIMMMTGKTWHPWDYLSPLAASRAQLPEGLIIALVVLSLPFMWIGATMSARRAVNAGLSAGLGLTLFFIPLINYLAMLAFCVLPEQHHALQRREQVSMEPGLRAALLGVGIATLMGVVLLLISVFLLNGYGMGLFVGTPFLMGVLSAFIFNRTSLRGMHESVGVACTAVVIGGGALLLFALEGFVCLVMAAPLALAMAALGGVLGRALAQRSTSQVAALVLMSTSLPVFMGMERAASAPAVHSVVTEMDIAAPPERVWPFVVGHSELPPPTEWFFRLGIAYPVHSTTYGEGVGATRHCTFSTGPLVEEITAWEPGRLLRFKAISQPAPMKELTPYNIEPPHLDGYVRSRTGEFRLTRLSDGNTRLTGTTEYESSLGPDGYWSLWSDALVSAVHRRVFQHIATLSTKAP
ncbi:MAG: SRPBCC family protein [Myxococcota bacterium]